MFEYLFIGALAGFFAGLLGVGGGMVVVPFLAGYFIYKEFPQHILMHLTIGTSLAAMITTTLASAYAHSKRIPFGPLIKKLIPAVSLGALLGSIIADFTYSHVLKALFAAVAFLIGIYLLFEKEPEEKKERPPHIGTSIWGTFLGTSSSLLGIGAGTVGLPFLTLYEGVRIHKAVGITAALSLLISVIGASTYLYMGLDETELPQGAIGFLYLPAVIGINLTSPLFAFLGTAAAHKFNGKSLRRIFGLFLIAVSIKMFLEK